MRLSRSGHGNTQTLEASDPSLYTYRLPGGAVQRFLMLEPSGRGLPPRLAAPGLEPEPNLVWRRVGEELVYEIDFR